MELDELKSAWKSVEHHIEMDNTMNPKQHDLKSKLDVKERLEKRCFLNMLLTIIGGTATVTSHLWAPVLLPAAWLVAFGCFCAIGAAAELYLLLSIRKISLWNNTVVEIINSTIGVKRYYRNMELYLTVSVTILFVWMSFIPPFAGNWRMILIWIFFAVSLLLEFRIYRKNISLLNRLSKEINNDNN